MPGYVIHIAIAKEYFYKHEKNKENLKEFIKGVISPDLTFDKSVTHYGKSPAYTSLSSFLENNNLDNAFNRGHFLHLVTDYLFYNHYLENFSKPQIYDDYDFLNKEIISKYNLELPQEIQDKVFFKKGKPIFLNMELVEKMIKEISNLNLFDVALEAKSSKWNTYKNLVKKGGI